jgi:hypothetical protein
VDIPSCNPNIEYFLPSGREANVPGYYPTRVGWVVGTREYPLIVTTTSSKSKGIGFTVKEITHVGTEYDGLAALPPFYWCVGSPLSRVLDAPPPMQYYRLRVVCWFVVGSFKGKNPNLDDEVWYLARAEWHCTTTFFSQSGSGELNFYYAAVSWLIFHGQGGCFIVQKVIHICTMGEEKTPYELERDVRVAELANKLLPVQKAAEDL